MKIGKVCVMLLAAAALMTGAPKRGAAQGLVFTFDEFGHLTVGGSTFLGFLSQEPISGLITLTYFLGPAVTAGDVGLTEPVSGRLSDILRFSGSSVWVFSDAIDGPEPGVLADGRLPVFLPIPPLLFPETGSEDFNGLFGYTPGPSDPGGGIGATYNFISDSAPEPGSLLLSFTGAAVLALVMRRRTRVNRDAARLM